MINLFTIGFTEKSAESFFNLLIKNGVKTLVDTRLNNVSQLAGYAKANDLKYFLKTISNINYIHWKEAAPTKELLSDYRNNVITWDIYENKYVQLLEKRNIARNLKIEDFNNACFLCSEHLPDKCHRRLLVEYINSVFPNISISHLY